MKMQNDKTVEVNNLSKKVIVLNYSLLSQNAINRKLLQHKKRINQDLLISKIQKDQGIMIKGHLYILLIVMTAIIVAHSQPEGNQIDGTPHDSNGGASDNHGMKDSDGTEHPNNHPNNHNQQDDSHETETPDNSNQQAPGVNDNPNHEITGFLHNNRTKLCSPGCSQCSNGNCSGCIHRYVYNLTSSLCQLCGQNCMECSDSNPNQCSSCIKGSYLDSSTQTCLPCAKTCLTCLGSATNCQSCPPGQFVEGNVCGSCQNNCKKCLNSTSCQACNNGFVLIDNLCIGCATSCSSCSSTNITQCTSCAEGLQLINSVCVSCPNNCLSCNKSKCITCIYGYNKNSNGLCVLNCQLPCTTCTKNQPSVCLSCYSGAILNGNKCVANISCNADQSCTDCGQGLGYALVGSQCIQCKDITNCVQCDSTNTSLCAICSNGYYVNSTGLCQSCDPSCTLCVSSSACIGCQKGYTLAQNQTQGQCLLCQSPCATCVGITTYCTSCVSGYAKKGCKCLSNVHVGFNFVINMPPAHVLGNISNLTTCILLAIGQNLTSTNAISFNSFTDGSTIVAGSYFPTSGSVSQGSSTLSSVLNSGSVGGFPITSSSVSVVGREEQQQKHASSNIGMLVGIVVGISVSIIIIVILVCIYRKKCKNSAVQTTSDQGNEYQFNEKNQKQNKSEQGADTKYSYNGENVVKISSQSSDTDAVEFYMH